MPSTARLWCATGSVGFSVFCSETNFCELLQVDHGQPSCCATLPGSRAWPTAISASILYLGYLCSVLGYYTWVLYLTLAIPIQFFRFKLCSGRHEIVGLLAREDRVQLYVYDLSNGLARKLSPLLLNKQVVQILTDASYLHVSQLLLITCSRAAQIEGVWHTSIVVGGLEYYFGCGVSQSSPGLTPFGRPVQVIELGYDPRCPSHRQNQMPVPNCERRAGVFPHYAQLA